MSEIVLSASYIEETLGKHEEVSGEKYKDTP